MNLKTQFEQEQITAENELHLIDVSSLKPSGPQKAATKLQAALCDIMRICPYIADIMLRPLLSYSDPAKVGDALIETFNFPFYHLILICDDPERTMDLPDIEKARCWAHDKSIRTHVLEAKDLTGPLLDNARRFSAGCNWGPDYMGDPMQALFRETRKKSVPYSKAIDILMKAGLAHQAAERELAGAITRWRLICDLDRSFDQDWPVWSARRKIDFTAKSHAAIKLISK
jgi:hypothetical protein